MPNPQRTGRFPTSRFVGFEQDHIEPQLVEEKYANRITKALDVESTTLKCARVLTVMDTKEGKGLWYGY